MDSRDAPTVPEAADAPSVAPTKLGRYALGEPLGSGGMGIVFRARDTVLDREVALKLLRPDATGDGARGLLHEAKALARLVHPNVVTVFDVGNVGDDIFIAMELVDGTTLRSWLATPRPWRAIVDMFVAFGRGLVALHALGMVHRDVKPSNVLLDPSGTPKLGDFGLVCPTGEDAHGVVMGTPGFMAPEQQRGAPVDARTDQYAFAVALTEALGAAAPAGVRALLARARDPEPARRFPTMTALLTALTRARRGPLRLIIAGTAIAGAAVIALVAWRAGRASGEADPCAPPDDELAAAWGPARQAAVRDHLRQIDPARGEERLAASARLLDPYAAAWRRQWLDACRATRVTAQQSEALLDRRMICLARGQRVLRATVDALASAGTPAAVDGAVRAVTELPALDACSDVAVLAETVPPPADPTARREYDAIATDIDALRVAMLAQGDLTSLAPRIEALVARARTLGHAGALASALLLEGMLHTEQEELAAARHSFEEVVQVAAGAHDDLLAADAWLRLLATAERDTAPSLAQFTPVAQAAVARAGNRPDDRALLALDTAQLAMAQRDEDAAATALETARAVLASAPDTPWLARTRLRADEMAATLPAAIGHWDDAVFRFRGFLATAEARLGPDHPRTIRARFNLSVSLRMLQRDDEALGVMTDAVRIGEARLPPSPKVVSLLAGLALNLAQVRRDRDAAAYAARALAMGRVVLPPGDVRLLDPLAANGAALVNLHEFARAIPFLREELELRRKRTHDEIGTGNAHHNLASSLLETDALDEAIAEADQAIALYQAAPGAQPDLPIASELLRADALGRRGDHAQALAALDQVLTRVTAETAEHLPMARWLRARELVALGRDVAQARRDIDDIRKTPDLSDDVATAIDTWRRAHP